MGFHFSGIIAWAMWRAIYLAKLPGLQKKVRVLLDWTLDLFFSKDIVQLATFAIRPGLQPLPAYRRETPSKAFS
jgi:NADH dehydrogenase